MRHETIKKKYDLSLLIIPEMLPAWTGQLAGWSVRRFHPTRKNSKVDDRLPRNVASILVVSIG